MSPMVACSQCRSVVPRTETVFSNDGDLLCNRCGAFDAAHAQVERARTAAHENASQNRGVIGLVVGAIEKASADRQAGQLHSELVATAYAGPTAVADTAACSRCRTVVPRSNTTLTLEGDPMCSTCAADYDAAADRKRLEGSLFLGFLWGFFLSLIGIGLTYALNRKPAEKKGAAVGAAIAGILAYIVLSIMLK